MSGPAPSPEETASPPVVAIDGPGGSGKTTVAAAVSERTGLPRLDTGSMYRGLAFAALRKGIDPGDAAAVEALARSTVIEPGPPVLVDGVDATAEIRAEEVTSVVSAVSAVPGVRREMVRRQRSWVAEHGGGVVEGRDIGTVVFPRARVKVYLTASASERARRRAGDLATGQAEVGASLERRDMLDSTRADSPLSVAPDAVVLDTTGRSVTEVVREVLSLL